MIQTYNGVATPIRIRRSRRQSRAAEESTRPFSASPASVIRYPARRNRYPGAAGCWYRNCRIDADNTTISRVRHPAMSSTVRTFPARPGAKMV